MKIAKTPTTPYYAVIFTSTSSDNQVGYEEMADKMVELAALQDGFLGIESARDEIGITVSYWKNLESIQKWKMNMEHQVARSKGKSMWYAAFKVRISKVERDYFFDKKRPNQF